MSDILLTMSDKYDRMSDMIDEITMREFLRNPKAVLPPPEAGLKVTRRDGSPFYIYPEKQDVRQKDADVRQMSDNLNGGEKAEKIIEGWCSLHFEKGVKYPLRKVTFEDENGAVVIKEQWACENCIKGLKNKGIGRVYYL